MEDHVRVGRVIGLLDDAKEIVEGVRADDEEGGMDLLRASSTITEAQNLLVGGDGPSPKMN